ncbi:MAG: hypothetical protein LBD84_00850, partial [Campylobacteraceae bacterium]|nr:hypothetical protein [Campylobacteraceae bacterium]
MKEIPKTDECIKMLKEVKVIFDPYLYESCFDEELFFKYIKLAMAILEIKLMPYVTDTVPDASDFDFDDKDGIFLDKLKNYPLVTADDLKKEFWSICPDLESIPKFLNVINVKFKEVNNEYSLGMETMENKYKILNKLVVEERISGSHECIFKDICYAAERYDFIIFKIKKVYEEFSEMAAPQQTKAQNDNTDKAQKQVVIQLTDEKKARLKSYFISG